MHAARTVSLALLVLLTGTAARAELGYVSLKDLTQSSDLVACAYIYNVQYIGKENLEKEFGRSLPYPGFPIAQAVILRPIKGSGLEVGQRIAIAGYSTWLCDATRVSKGERAIFFLNRKDDRFSVGRNRRAAEALDGPEVLRGEESFVRTEDRHGQGQHEE